jgi:predicted nucleotidyltransferase
VLPADVIARVRHALTGREDVHLAWLFGSRARGRARADSDVDVAVSGPVDLLDLRAELTLALDLEVDVVSLEEATIPLLQALVRDGMVIHEGRRGAGARWRSQTLATLETDGPWYARMSEAWLRHLAEKGVSRG